MGAFCENTLNVGVGSVTAAPAGRLSPEFRPTRRVRQQAQSNAPSAAPIAGGDLAAQLRYWRRAAIAGLMLATVLAGALGVVSHMSSLVAPGVHAATSRSDAPAAGSMHWGRLETEQIILERPDRLLDAAAVYSGEDRVWRFGGASADAVDQLLRDAGLDAASKDWLLDRKNWLIVDGLLQIVPPEDLLWRLSPRARGRIYGYLATIPGNQFKTNPFKIPTRLAPQWFADAGISTETERVIRSLTYELGPMLCFSDPGLLSARIPPAEHWPALKALSRQPARRAFLRIQRGDDLAQVTNYWAAGGKIPAMLPLLEALQASTNGGRIDLAYLMPPFCRERLFQFPDRANHPEADQMDCFWTALNFFRHPPQQRFMDNPLRLRHLQDHYEPQTGEPGFGDLVVLYGANQEPMHACVYIAGDIVFTKNGGTLNSPWVFMSYADMLGYYSMDETPVRRVLRTRPIPPS